METLESLGRQIGAVEDLQSVVKTMKSMAAVNIRHYEEAVRALREFTRSLDLGMRALFRNVPDLLTSASEPARGRVAAIVFGSDQGMCGQFNTRIVAYTVDQLDRIDKSDETPLICGVGARVGAELDASHLRLVETLMLPGSLSGISHCAEDLLLRINHWRENERVRRVWLFHQHPLSGASYDARGHRVIPLADRWLHRMRTKPWPTRVLPTFTMDWRMLLGFLVRQHLFASIYRALAESMAAENAARLASMQAAEKNIDERLDDLTTHYHRQRQNAITEELLDVTAGFEVLRSAEAKA